jgi:hypothetical protein
MHNVYLTHVQKPRRAFEKIVKQLENTCCLPESLIECRWIRKNVLCRPTMVLPSIPFQNGSRPVTEEVEEQDRGRRGKLMGSDKDLIAESTTPIDAISRKLHGEEDIEERAASAEVQGTASVDDVFMEEDSLDGDLESDSEMYINFGHETLETTLFPIPIVDPVVRVIDAIAGFSAFSGSGDDGVAESEDDGVEGSSDDGREGSDDGMEGSDNGMEENQAMHVEGLLEQIQPTPEYRVSTEIDISPQTTSEEKDQNGFSDEELGSCLSEPKGIESGTVQVEVQCGSEERNEVAEIEENFAGDAEDPFREQNDALPIVYENKNAGGEVPNVDRLVAVPIVEIIRDESADDRAGEDPMVEDSVRDVECIALNEEDDATPTGESPKSQAKDTTTEIRAEVSAKPQAENFDESLNERSALSAVEFATEINYESEGVIAKTDKDDCSIIAEPGNISSSVAFRTGTSNPHHSTLYSVKHASPTTEFDRKDRMFSPERFLKLVSPTKRKLISEEEDYDDSNDEPIEVCKDEEDFP